MRTMLEPNGWRRVLPKQTAGGQQLSRIVCSRLPPHALHTTYNSLFGRGEGLHISYFQVLARFHSAHVLK